VLVLTALVALLLPLGHLLGEWGLSLLFGNGIRAYAYMLLPILLTVYGTALFGFFCMLAVTLRAFLPLIASCALCLTATAVLSRLFLTHAGENGASLGMTLAYLCASALLFGGVLYRLYHPKGDSHVK